MRLSEILRFIFSVKVVLMAPLKYNTKINILCVILSC